MHRWDLIMIHWIFAPVLALFLAAGAWAAGPWYVATNGADTGNDGLSWSQPFATISNAISHASLNDIINVSNGVYIITDTVSNGTTKASRIIATSTNPVDTILLGPGTNDVINIFGVYMEGAGSTLEGFTVTNFYFGGPASRSAGVNCLGGLVSNCIIAGNTLTNTVSAGCGGGLRLTGNGVADNCTVIGNRASGVWYEGGGVVMNGSAERIRNCRIVGNSLIAGNGGGGVFTYYGGNFVIQDSVIASNTANNGAGGISMPGGTISNCQVFANSGNSFGGISITPFSGYNSARIERCVISNNVGSNYHGGGWISGTVTNVLISQCAIVSNYCGKTGNGGLGVDKIVTNAWIRNCLVANNRAIYESAGWGGYGGGGMSVLAANALIENCTIASNTLTGAGQGAGLYATNGVRVVNCIIYHNQFVGGDSSNVYASTDSTFSNSCVAPLPAAGSANIDTNPRFIAKETGNFRLNANSPCINTGMNQDWMIPPGSGTVDLDERMRVRYGIVDMGAYERIYSGTIYNFQ